MFCDPPPRSTRLARLLRGAALAGATLLAALPVNRAEGQITPQIVNGEPEFAEPTTAALLQGLIPTTALVVCSATLVGCDLAISAGHCFNGVIAAERKTLYFQHAGFYEIESAVRHPVYANCIDQGMGICSDLAITRQEDISVIKLTTPVTGIVPSTINVTATPGPATPGRIVGFGRDQLTEPDNFHQNAGIKRSGSMTLAACQAPSLSPYDILCWDPSEEASTCNIDSGGPLFVDQSGARIVAGLTKAALLGGSNPCGVEAFDTNVYRHHTWIAQTAAQLGAIDLSVKNCGILPQMADDDDAGACTAAAWFEGESPRVCGFQGELSTSVLDQLHSFQVPAFTQRLRVNLNGISRTANPVDVSYYVRAGTAPTTSVYDCAGVATGNFATCEFNNPQAGTWYVRAVWVSGSGTDTAAYQITATEFGPNPDTDEDGLEDPFDNCTLVSNAAQKDLDVDGCGDLCDGDFNNDGVVGPSDFNTFKSAYLTSEGGPGYNPLADMDCNGSVSPMDYSIFKSGYTSAPGPSGLPPELKTFPACP